MNYNNWNGRRSSRGRGRNRNKWSWRGRSYNRMPMLDPMMHNAHPGYNQNYQMHHENRGFYNYKSFVSPSHRKISPPPKPPSPLPGTEEYTQRNIQHASDLIKRQLNIDSDTCSASDVDINKTSEHSTDNAKDDKAVDNDKSNNATVTSTRNTQEPKKSVSSQQSSKQKATSKPSECINVQEIYTQIVQHISNLSHSKKINLVNQSTDGYDIAIQQVQKQKRLELSRALRDMSKRQTQNSNDGEVINAIIPDIGIKIEDLPKEVIADLSRTLHIELEDRVEQVSNLVDPEVCFKQAEAILSVNFENAMEDQGFNQSDNFVGFQGIANTFNYDYLNKPLSPPEFTYNQLEEADKFATPSTSNLPFSPPKPVPFPGMNPDEVKTEETESDDFTADIDFCIKNLDVHKSYLTCFSSPKQLEARNALFEATDGSLKLPQIKVRTDLLTQSPVEMEAVLENQNLLTGSIQNLQPLISSDMPQLPTCNIHSKVVDSDLQLDSSSSVSHAKLPDGLEQSTAKIASGLTLDSQLEQNLKSDTKINSPDTVDKSDPICPEFSSLMNEGDGHKDPKCSEKRSGIVTQCVPIENKEEEIAQINKISESELQPSFTLIDEKVPSALPDLFAEFTSAKAEGLKDDMKRDDYPETDANLNPESIFVSALSKTTLPEKKPEIAPSELVVEETELVFPSTHIKVDDPFPSTHIKVDEPLLEMPAPSCSDNILAEGTLNNEDKKLTDASLSAIPESVLHTHAEGPQKRWKSPGEKKMIPNVPSSVSQPVVQDNSNVTEKTIDDIMNESDDITKSILEQMEEFNRSLMGITTEKEKTVNVTTNKQGLDNELDFLDDKSILAPGTATQVNEEVEETQDKNVMGSQPIEKSIESDDTHQKRAKSEPRDDQEMSGTVDTTNEEKLKMEVKEENVSEAQEPTKGDEVDDKKNIDLKFPIENVELKKELADLESSSASSSSKSKDIKSELVEKEVDAAKSKHKESSKERSRSNSKEKQHHRSGSKSKGHHQESHKSSKNKPKQTQDGGSSYRKIKTPAEKKETINLKILKIMSGASTQTDFTEQPKKGKREVARNSATQTDVLQQAPTKKGKVTSTQTDFVEQQQPSKKAKAIEKKDSANVVSTQTDFPEPPQNKKAKTYTLSTQTDLVEPAQSKKVKTYTLSTQTDSVEPIHSKKGGKLKETKSVQTDFCDPKKGKPEKIKSKNSGTQSEATKTHSREIQATSSFKSIEIQTEPFKMSLGTDAVDINLNTEGIVGKMMLRKYAVRKLKDIGAQIEHLMKLQQSFYELMLESDDESEAQGTTQVDSPEVEPEKKDLRIKLEDVQQIKPITKKESAPKSRKRKAEVSNEDKRSKRLKHSDKAESTVAEPPVDEADTNACLGNINTTNKKDRRKRRIEGGERSAAETRGPLNIKISLKNLKASPYRNEEETVTKQKSRKGRDSKTKEKSVKIKEEKEDTTINELITEEVHVKEEIPEVSVKQEILPDDVEDPLVQSEPEEQKQILKIKLPLKRFRSKKANSEARELVNDVNLMMSRYSRELSKVPRGSDTRSKRKSERRSKQSTSSNIPEDLNEVQKHDYDKRFFSCNVSLRRYNLQELNHLKETIHLEPEVKSEQILSDTPDVNIDNLSGVPNLDLISESPVKSENIVEPSPPALSDKTSFDMSPISLQMLDELKQVVDSAPETSDIAVTGDAVTTDDQEIEFNTFNSALLILKVINSTMLAGSETGKLYYYNIENGDVLHAMHLSKKPLTSICVSKHEDKSIVHVGSLNGKISVFDFETKHVANTIKLDEGVQCMELSWDYLFIGTHKGQLVRYDLKKEKVDDSIKIYDTSILAVKATQEGARRVLLLATRNELVSVRDAMTGLLMRTMESSFYPTVYTILLNNNFVYCGTSHHDILVYTFQDGQMAFTHEASNSKGVACLKTVGNLLFAGCYNGNVYVYNITTNDYLGQIVGPGMILSLEVLEDKIFLGTKNNKLKCLRIPKNFLDQL